MEIIDISTWELDPQFPIHPQGNKPKQIRIAPTRDVPPGIISGHRYLFKIAHQWKAQQAWSEYISYRLAAILHHPVPPCFVAMDGEGNTGALVEFFFGYPGEESPAQFFHAAEILAGVHRTLATGRPNNILENARICRIVLGPGAWARWWAKAIAFDALIGNGDRHTENWGFLVKRTTRGTVNYSLAPLYDNGTSLGYQTRDVQLESSRTDQAIRKFVDKGRTHVGWDMTSDHCHSPFELCRKLLERHPELSSSLERYARFEMSQVTALLDECVKAQTGVPFTHTRAQFVAAQIGERRRRLKVLLGH